MPKELSHWILAEKAAVYLKAGVVKEAVSNHPHFYYLGAVVYDCPFYAFGVENAQALRSAARLLHGVDGNDTYEPFRLFIQSFHRDDIEISAEALSFIAGAVTHLCGDVTFHPLVNYFSGNERSADRKKRPNPQRRHRRLEALLDLYFCGRTASLHPRRSGARSAGDSLLNRGRFSTTAAAVAANPELAEDIIGRFYWPEDRLAGVPVLPLLKRHGLIQKQFFNRGLTGVLGFLGMLLGGSIGITAATFYPVLIQRKALRNPEKTFPFFFLFLSIYIFFSKVE